MMTAKSAAAKACRGGLALAALGALTLSALGLSHAQQQRQQGALHASATLVNPGGRVLGFAHFIEDATGRVHVNVHVKGLSPGPHGIHIHAVGECDGTTTPPFTSAGGHYNPYGREHGLENPEGPHAGDLPNLVVNRAGVGHLNTVTDRVSLSAGPATLFDADGSALIIHAQPDDQMTHPTGGSGGRIACGVIEPHEMD
jgi:Cu-Zn family superoxide dismutase